MLLAILSCLYLLSTSGMQVQHHFCMGHLKATTIGFHENKKCSTCGMETGSNECCHDESQWLKVKDNHAAAIISSAVPAPFEIVLPPAIYYSFPPAARQMLAESVNNHSPPLLLPTDRNVLFCVFRI